MRRILIKRFGLTSEQAGRLKADLMEHISKGILASMHQDEIKDIEDGEDPLDAADDAPAAPGADQEPVKEDEAPSEPSNKRKKNHKSIQIGDDLIDEWQLGGFNFGVADET